MTKTPRPLPVIYIVDASVAITGAFICARNIARSLADTARVVLIIPTNSTLQERDTMDFSAVYRLPIYPLRRRLLAIIRYLPALLAASIQLRWLMWRDRSTGLIINDFYLMHGALCRLLCFRGKILTWVRITPSNFGYLLSRLWLFLAGGSSTSVIAVSNYIAALLPQSMRPIILYDVIDPMPAEPSPSRQERFIFVGNYVPGKGQDDAIRAFAKLAGDFPDLSLHFFGGDMNLSGNRAYKAALERLLQAERLEGRVYLHEFSDDFLVQFEGGLAALNFSEAESFSMTVLEASANGLPVVATCSGGPSEIIIHGETGFLVPVRDIPAMSSAMRILAADRTKAAAMGRAGRQHVADKFSPEIFRKTLVQALSLTDQQ